MPFLFGNEYSVHSNWTNNTLRVIWSFHYTKCQDLLNLEMFENREESNSRVSFCKKCKSHVFILLFTLSTNFVGNVVIKFFKLLIKERINDSSGL